MKRSSNFRSDVHFYKDKKRHVITTQSEHTWLDLQRLKEAIRPDAGLVSTEAEDKIHIIPLMNGGGQERGTLATQQVFGFGVAWELKIWRSMMRSGLRGGSLLMGLKEVAVSSASACTSVSLEPSYVLRALGVDEDMSHTSIRFGIGRFTTEEEIDKPVRAYG
ncbi:hypothetical protein IGI04_024100 [Brassica rapa subsp. trilocularis]|uniref:Cysteine desulfurase n=1 Tax=Brassica rapa subsp. trilocularis TaxID=1813537 RepID=A0ABQ7M6C2_BRACM|nr:hypothetical protein IGI04_024100 [Brassica rapa subsp. trilocularis]